MVTINPDLVPSIAPGSLFSRFTTDTSINIRWLLPVDPASAPVLNRPLGDIALRQLILAKTVDNLNLRLSHQARFPFLVQPQVNNGTQNVDVPPSWIWDMQVSLPKKWENVRLAKIKRISGSNPGTGVTEYTGILRLVFTAQEVGSTTEVAIFQVDYSISSDLTFQQSVQVSVPIVSDEPLVLPQSESETIGGFITFRTLPTGDAGVQAFLNVLAPTMPDTDSNGVYLSPTIVELNDSLPGGAGVTNGFDFVAVSHGSGLLTLSATNPIPSIDSTVTTWINTFNYPFDSTATLQASSATGVVIPTGLFKEFNILAPASDEPTGDVSGNYFPVYVNRIERLDPTADNLRFYFATFNVDSPSIVPVEFATLDISRTMAAGRIVPINPNKTLFPTKADDSNWQQGFGQGHVVLSDLWSMGSTVSDFFDSFQSIIDDPAQAIFTKEATRISSYGVSRASKNSPTSGQAAALRGSKAGISDPSSANRFVVEGDQGKGTQVDLVGLHGENPDIERYGWAGSLTHRVVSLVMNSGGDDHDYDTDVLPRLRSLYGRDPGFGDFWWDGTRLKFHNGDTWVG